MEETRAATEEETLRLAAEAAALAARQATEAYEAVRAELRPAVYLLPYKDGDQVPRVLARTLAHPLLGVRWRPPFAVRCKASS